MVKIYTLYDDISRGNSHKQPILFDAQNYIVQECDATGDSMKYFSPAYKNSSANKLYYQCYCSLV